MIGEVEIPSCPQELSERKNWFCVTLKMVDFTDVDHDFAVITLIFYLYGQVTLSTGFKLVSSEAGQRYLVLRNVDVAGPIRSIPLGVRVVRSVDLVRLSKMFTDEIPIFRHVGEDDVLGELLAVRIVLAHP